MFDLMRLLVCALMAVCADVSSTKTRRYVLDPALHNVYSGTKDAPLPYDGMPVMLVRLVATFLTVLNKRSRTSTVAVGEDVYSVGDYEFPVNWWVLAHARRVYASDSAVDAASPLFQVGNENLGIDLLTPFQVSKFFREFNAGQDDGSKVSVAKADDSFDSYAVLNEMKALVAGNGTIVPMFDGGTIPEAVAVVLNYVCPFRDSCVTSVSRMSEEVLYRWLVLLI